MQEAGWKDIGLGTTAAVVLQLTLGLPFLLQHPRSYINKAFEFSRVFLYQWSVNWRFLPETVFLSKPFAIVLLVLHVSLLLTFAHMKWCKSSGGLQALLWKRLQGNQVAHEQIFAKQKLLMLFSGNFIGIICARTLHFQFYSWYFHMLPFLLWQANLWTPLRLIVFGCIEIAWNVFPTTFFTTSMLFCCHCILLAGIWQGSASGMSIRPKKQ